MTDAVELIILRYVWYALLALIASFVFFGRRDHYLKGGAAIIFIGYVVILLTQQEGASAVGHWIVRVGYTLLLVRLAMRRKTEKIE